MLDLHLYFVKKFGCLAKQAHAEGQSLPIDLSSAAQAIMTGTECSHLYLAFGCRTSDDPPIARAKATAYKDSNGNTFALDWCH